jgi:CheY-like chemotaxis protein
MKILVVDDELDVRSLYEQRFRREIRDNELVFAFAHSGEEALKYLGNLNRESVLVLSDINMPGMSGLELLKHIKSEFEKPPPVVMMVTAFGDDENYNLAMNLGADDFFTKPLDFLHLREKLKMVKC